MSGLPWRKQGKTAQPVLVLGQEVDVAWELAMEERLEVETEAVEQGQMVVATEKVALEPREVETEAVEMEELGMALHPQLSIPQDQSLFGETPCNLLGWLLIRRPSKRTSFTFISLRIRLLFWKVATCMLDFQVL
jgi:hypothetical protein